MPENAKPGFMALHPDTSFNFLMNRLARSIASEDLLKVSGRISGIDDWLRETVSAAEAAEVDGRLSEAATWWRGAEFYMAADAPRKAEAYERFRELHDKANPGLASQRRGVPFAGGQLPAIDLPPSGTCRGTVLAHSGFDGLMEEMCPALSPLVEEGYRVIAFEGPGQGAALRQAGLHMSHDWEKPVGAILDHFGLDECTLIGMSLGGYLAPRAAAFESRIQRVVAWGAMYDFAGSFERNLGAERFAALAGLVRAGARDPVNAAVRGAMDASDFAKWAIGHGMHVSGAADPYEFFAWVLKMNLREVSDRIEQDVLLVMGNQDHLVPFDQVHEQARALIRARSITVRITTAKEQGAEHCQVGNPSLVVDEILRWLDGLARRDAHLANKRSPLLSDAAASV